MRNRYKAIVAAGLAAILTFPTSGQNLVLQGFWWDYWNSNYPNNWSSYLADLAPRLKEIGVDAVWVPPLAKGDGQSNVGYGPFDQYDLGDKYQKGFVATRVGNKDQVLRMIAVLHANGIEVIEDLVLNHVTGSGSQFGHGSNDPEAWDGQYKNFRYACYATPADNEDEENYLAREGRFPKNWQNFHANPGHQANSDDWTSDWWGPDFCYYEGAYGQSSNAIYNPEQGPNYVRDQMRAWAIWLVKQTDVDGFRIDAVKHFPNWALEDILWNVQNNAGWASRGEDMYAIGEYVDFSGSALDGWMSSVQNRAGTFDFDLRDQFKSLVQGSGFHDIGGVIGHQQNSRVFYLNDRFVHRTGPFVNNHDVFRPLLSEEGNYTGWDHAHQLADNIEPNDGRMSACYAIALAVDGSPCMFFEDLFNIGYMGNRYSHDPRDESELPFWSDRENLAWCHHHLKFKDGEYKVPWKSADLLVIDRAGKAIIGATDNWNTWQTEWVYTSFSPGTVLIDYSGASDHEITVMDDGKAQISVPPCDGSANNGRRGYAVWAPKDADISSRMDPIRTTQEWEMAQDLGDSHPQSLGQGGALPTNTDWRTVCWINVAANEPVNYELYTGGESGVELAIIRNDNEVHNQTGTANIDGTYTPGCNTWIGFKIRHTENGSPEEKAWVKINYLAPADGDGSGEGCIDGPDGIEDMANTARTFDLIQNPIPAGLTPTLQIKGDRAGSVHVSIYDMAGRIVHRKLTQIQAGRQTLQLDVQNQMASGEYVLEIAEWGESKRFVIQ